LGRELSLASLCSVPVWGVAGEASSITATVAYRGAGRRRFADRSFREDRMTLADRPPFIVRWETGLPPEILQGIGKLSVISSQIEQLLHQIYWKYAGLKPELGPIVTDNLNPKRLS
jgi:hypothetical protein